MESDPYLTHFKPQSGNTILDLGAGTGAFPLVFAEELKGCNVFLLEGFSSSVQTLKQKWGNKPGFHIIHSLIGDKDGTEDFVITTQSACNYKKSTNQDVSRWGQQDLETISMPVMTLDTLLNTTGPVDFLKCDIEGAELEVFMSCTKLDMIKNMCIASYHIVNGQMTWITLKPFFESKGFNAEFFLNDKGQHAEPLLYLSR